MPQFDKITFFNQIFWLFVFFSGYYLLLLKVFLPKLGAVLKARSKKLQKGTEGVVGFKQEQEQVRNQPPPMVVAANDGFGCGDGYTGGDPGHASEAAPWSIPETEKTHFPESGDVAAHFT